MITAKQIDGRVTYWTGQGHRAAGPADTGERHNTWTGYDPQCDHCWMGHRHTVERHVQKTGGVQCECGHWGLPDDPVCEFCGLMV